MIHTEDDLTIIEKTDELKPGWILCYEKDVRDGRSKNGMLFCQYVVATGGGHYDLIDANNNGWTHNDLFDPGHKVYLVETESYSREPLSLSRYEFLKMCEDSYHLITNGPGCKNDAWWSYWSRNK